MVILKKIVEEIKRLGDWVKEKRKGRGERRISANSKMRR